MSKLFARLCLVAALALLIRSAVALPLVAIDTEPGIPGIQSFKKIHDLNQVLSVGIFVQDISALDGLGAFQFDVAFDSLVLRPLSLASANALPSPVISASILVPEVRLAETSVSAFGPFPFGDFVLATVNFLTVGAGLSSLDLNDTVLSDQFGFQIDHGVADASVAVAEPPTPLLLGSCLMLLLGTRCLRWFSMAPHWIGIARRARGTFHVTTVAASALGNARS